MKKILSYIVYWLIQCTWGLPMTLLGALSAIILLITNHKPKRLGPTIYFEIGQGWGGLELGGFFLCSKSSPIETKYHECGHSIQNLFFGPFMPFIVSIPSALRYWIRKMPSQTQKYLFNIKFIILSLLISTFMICLTGPICHFHWVTIILEFLRFYLISIGVWLSQIEIPKYQYGYIEYDEIWFEKQATDLGIKLYKKEKRED